MGLISYPPLDSVDDKSPRPGRFVTDEDQSLRLKWTAHLEFTQNQELGELTWDKVVLSILFDTQIKLID